MRHFTLNLVVNIIGAVLFLVMGIALIISFVLNLSTEEELQQVRTLFNSLFHVCLLVTGS